MNKPHDDHRLREAFAAQRREEAARAPAFRRPVHAPSRSRASWRPALATATIAAAAVAAWMLFAGEGTRRGPPHGSQPIALASWSEPTAFLLKMPGGELLSGTPVLGRVDPIVGPAHAN